MFCHNCGTRLSDTAKFCPSCGQERLRAAGGQRQEPVAARTPRNGDGDAGGRWRRYATGCGAGLLLLVFLCGVGSVALYFFLGMQQTNRAASLIAADETLVYTSVSPSVRQLPALLRGDDLETAAVVLAPLAAAPGVLNAAAILEDELPRDLDIDPVRDLLPWMGPEMGIVVLNEGDSSASRDTVVAGKRRAQRGYSGPPLLLTIAARSERGANRFLADVREQLAAQGLRFSEQRYRDVLVTEVSSLERLPLAYATFEGVVVVGTSMEAIYSAIDLARGGTAATTLREAEAFQDMLEALPGNRLAFTYVDVAAVVESLPPDLESMGLGAVDRAAMSVTMHGRGLRVDTLFHYDTSLLDASQERWLRLPATRPTLPSIAPNESFLFFSRHNLNAFLDEMAPQARDEFIAELEMELNVNLDHLLQAMSGQFGVALARGSGDMITTFDMPVSYLIMAEVTDGEEIMEALEIVGQQLAFQEGLAFNAESLGDTTFWLLEAPGSTSEALGYGLIGDTLAVGTSRRILASVGAQDEALGESERYREVVATLPDENWGMLYVDGAQLRRMMNSTLTAREMNELWGGAGAFLWELEAVGMAMEPLDDQDYLRMAVSVLMQAP